MERTVAATNQGRPRMALMNICRREEEGAPEQVHIQWNRIESRDITGEALPLPLVWPCNSQVPNS
jgi:hypothetical protein